MKNIKQIRESYDFVTDKSVRDQRNLDALVEAGLFEERKLPVLKKILESSADRMSGSEKRFVVSLLESLIVQFANQDLIEAKGDYLSKYDPRGPKGQPSDSELPPVIILKRKAIRVYPDHQKVALYYAQTIDRYVSIPYGGNHVMTVNEETDDDKKRPVPQKKKKQVPLEKREDLTMADLPAVRRYLMKSAFTSQDPLRAAMINLGTYSGIKSRLKKASRMKKSERIEPQFTDIPKKSVPKVLPTTASSPVAKAAEGVWKQRRLEESFKDRLEVLREQALPKYSEPSYTGADRFMRTPDIAEPVNQNKNIFKKKPSIRKELKNLQQKVDRTKRVSPVDAKQKPGKSDGAREKFRKAAQERIARKAAEVKPDKVTGKSVVPSILKTVGPTIGKVLRFGIARNPLIGAIQDATPLNAGEAEWLKDKETTKRITAREPGGSQDLAKQTKKRDAAAAATMLKDRGIKKTTTSFLNAPDKPVPQISTTQEPVVSSAPSALTRQLSVQQQAQAQQPSQAQALASQPAQAPAQQQAQQSNKDRKEEEGKKTLKKDDTSKRRNSGPKDRKLRRTRPGRFNMPDISLPSMPPGAKEPGPNYQFGLKAPTSTPTPVTNTAAVGKWMDIINRKANQAMLRENQTKDDEDETGSATRTADDKPIYNFRRRPRVGISKATGTDAAVQAWLNRIGRQANLAMLRQQDQQESVLLTIQSMVENNIAESTIIIGEQPITINNTVAKKIVSIHESMNKKNKKKMEEMLNESASSFNKVLTFAVRH